jgi:hypothetical protein
MIQNISKQKLFITFYIFSSLVLLLPQQSLVFRFMLNKHMKIQEKQMEELYVQIVT